MRASIFGFLVPALLLSAGCASTSQHREPASAASAVQALSDSGWEGSFSIGGVQHGIRIGFLPSTSPNSVQYYHAVINGIGASEIKEGDGACEFTPRLIEIQPQNQSQNHDQKMTGTIHVYPCASSAAEEQSLHASSSRGELALIPVRRFELSSDGQTLQIDAILAGAPAYYTLKRQSLDPNTLNSEQNLRNWVVH